MNKSPCTLYKPPPAVKKVDTIKTEQNKKTLSVKNVVNNVMIQVNVGQEIRELVRTLLLTKPRFSLAHQAAKIRTKITEF